MVYIKIIYYKKACTAGHFSRICGYLNVFDEQGIKQQGELSLVWLIIITIFIDAVILGLHILYQYKYDEKWKLLISFFVVRCIYTFFIGNLVAKGQVKIYGGTRAGTIDRGAMTFFLKKIRGRRLFHRQIFPKTRPMYMVNFDQPEILAKILIYILK